MIKWASLVSRARERPVNSRSMIKEARLSKVVGRVCSFGLYQSVKFFSPCKSRCQFQAVLAAVDEL